MKMTTNRKDKAFHLLVSLVALVITGAAAVTLVYSHRASLMAWWSHLNVAKTTGSAVLTPNSAVRIITKQNTQPGEDILDEPTYTPMTLNSLVIVKPYRKDVSAAQITAVNQLLEKYNIVQTVSKSLQMNVYQPIEIYLAANASDYQSKLSELGFSRTDAKQLTIDTGGYTQGNIIVIPLYQNTKGYDMANTLAHELTHVFLNINVGRVPSWINEGIAVHEGMLLQKQVGNEVAYEGYARRMAESVLDAVRRKQLIPLTDDENKVLAGHAPYDLELQDWLAVNALLNQNGPNALRDFFFRLKLSESVSTAFARSFHQTPGAYNTWVTNLLASTEATQDKGVVISIDVPGTYKGDIRVLQHGSQDWQGFRGTAGTDTFTLTPQGRLEGSVSQTSPTHDTTPADNGTVYIDLDPDKAFVYNGQVVDDCGFAIDYHDGLYGFVNTWITLDNGKSIYGHQPILFGVSIASVAEVESANAIATLIS